MREIKFRGKEINTGEWVYGFYTQGSFIDPNTGKETIRHIINNGMLHDVVPETIGQYTGLKDKNGKEIYEGDIVKFTNLNTCVGIVQWDLCNPCMCISYKNEYGYEDIEYDFIKAGNMLIEVIGNIHDNPELIKQR